MNRVVLRVMRNLAIALVSQLNKGAGSNAKYRVAGSIAYGGACRANFLFVRDKDGSTSRRVLMLSAGCNLGDDPPTLAYRIGDDGDGPAVVREPDPVDITAEAALSGPGPDDDACSERDPPRVGRA